jgi:hypothetical protein
VVLYFIVFPAEAEYSGGTGEPNDPYQIATAEDLMLLGDSPEDYDRHFILTADIDLDPNLPGRKVFDRAIIDFFTGVFDGNEHIISNFTYECNGVNRIGLFGYVYDPNALVKNLGLIGPKVDAGTGSDVGALVGELKDGAVIGCYAEGANVSGSWRVGGLVGENWGSVINCYSTGTVTGNRYVGGLVGSSSFDTGTIERCHSTAMVIGGHSVGGLAGGNFCVVIDSYSTGLVSGRGSVGGLVGSNGERGHVSRCYSTGTVSGKGDDVGGLVGYNYRGNVVRCYSTGTVCGDDVVGGLVGNNWSGTVYDCYSIGSANGRNSIGGLVGNNRSDVANCYSASKVNGTNAVGGLVGSGNPDTVRNSLWDVQESGLITSVGGTGETTAAMQTAKTFLDVGWDFVGESENGTEDIWLILEGQDYPMLRGLAGDHRPGPVPAFCFDPEDGATDIIQSPILSWASGGVGLQYDVYFGEDKQAVANATAESLGVYRGRQPDMTTYEPGQLEWGRTYYWRIDAVDEDDPWSLWKGNVWSFTTANFIVVDDFESYNAIDPPDLESHRIFDIWMDGFWSTTNGAFLDVCGALPTVQPPGCRPRPIHGGSQSMDFYYDNSGTAYYSEVTMTLTDLRDWSIEGVRVLSLWLYGDPGGAPESVYVALANESGVSATVYHDDPNIAQTDTWTEWRIDLSAPGGFANQGVDLTNVDSISIGFGDKNNPQSGGSGLVFFDDIRLYRSASQEPEPTP